MFKNKTLLLPCDDPEWSNFTKYFVQNFTRLGLKKLISTSFAPRTHYQTTLFESNMICDKENYIYKGKIFTLLDSDIKGDIDINNLKWTYLQGDGDFRSNEIKALLGKTDIIVTNPPFSLFREFLAWIMEANKKFIVLANKNCITYKEVFPLIKDNKLWAGKRKWAGGMWFKTINKDDVDKMIDGVNMKNVSSIWLTNLEHGKRHERLNLKTMINNLNSNKKLKDKYAYIEYDNYKAIEVPFSNAIPSDFSGVMGVPISFLDKYSPEQFEILGIDTDVKDGKLDALIKDSWKGKLDRAYLNNKRMYSRIFIRLK